MLHARIEVAQILSMYQVRCVITEFAPGTDPTTWSSKPLTIDFADAAESHDALTTVLELIRLWSEMTISD